METPSVILVLRAPSSRSTMLLVVPLNFAPMNGVMNQSAAAAAGATIENTEKRRKVRVR